MPEYSKASKARVPDQAPEYNNKGRLTKEAAQIERYRTILDKDNFQPNEPHWRRISKNTVSLFQVLIDQDLQELVMVLEHYPRYTEWVCEHFRYAYSYSENEADIEAASELLKMGEPYFTKQFVRNVVRKLPRIDSYTLDEISGFVPKLAQASRVWHPIITKHYHSAVMQRIDQMRLHPLQRIAVIRMIEKVQLAGTFDYDAEDRDATLDIPYMH
jgi:hypothetical protein